MLHLPLEHGGVATLTVPLGPQWRAEQGRVAQIVRDFHAGARHYSELEPCAELASLRLALREAAPGLAAFCETIERTLASGRAGVFIPALGLDRCGPNSRAMIAYALCSLLGEPTATDHARRQIIWDVTPRHVGADYFATFSEHDREAEFHTDTQYFPAPERFFMLYVLEPAECGGGKSRVCDARVLRDALAGSGERWVLEHLGSRPLPFRVPTAFTETRDGREIIATLAPIFGDAPFVRYRRDTLLEGLRHFPAYAEADTWRALDALERALETGRASAEFFMPRDSSLIVDNHHALHARTAFEDRSRHLLRIRVQKPAPATLASDAAPMIRQAAPGPIALGA